MGIRRIELQLEPAYLSEYPPAQSDTYVKATSKYNEGYWPYLATDKCISLVGSITGQSWLSSSSAPQRFHIDLGTAKIIKQIYYENMHHFGTSFLTAGVKNFTLWGSNVAGAFADLTYGDDSNWTQLTTDVSAFDEHVASDISDPKFISVTGSVAYRYYAFKFADNWGDGSYMGFRRVVLKTETTPSIPAAPENVLATPGDTQNTITWNPSTGATSYNIYWDLTTGVTKETGTKIEAATSPFIHDELDNGTEIFYVVTAVNGAGESDESEEVSATPASGSPAAVPGLFFANG